MLLKAGIFFFDAVQPIQVPVGKPITKTAKKLIQQFFSDADNEDPVRRRKSRNKFPYRIDSISVQKVDFEEKTNISQKKNPRTSEKGKESEDEKLN